MAQRLRNLNDSESTIKLEDSKTLAEEETRSLSRLNENSQNEPSHSTTTLIDQCKPNSAFFQFLISGLLSHTGEWVSWIAYVSIMNSFHSGTNTKEESVLLTLRIIPRILFYFTSGVLADTYDRKNLLVWFNYLGVFIVISCIFTFKAELVHLLYMFIFVQEMIGAFQEPIMDAILPMFFSNKNGLKFGIVTTEIFWAFAATFGITIGKVIQTRYNDPMINLVLCGLMHFSSAFLLQRLKGNYIPNRNHFIPESNSYQRGNNQTQIHHAPSFSLMFIQCGEFLKKNPRIFYVLMMKANGMFIFGVNETIYGFISKRKNKKIETLAIDYNLGHIVGPLVLTCITDMNHPWTLEISCIMCLGALSFSWIGLSYFFSSVSSAFFFTLASCETEALWVGSDIFLLSFSQNSMLGRLIAFDKFMSLMAELSSALIVKLLQDKFHLSTQIVSLAMGMCGIFVFTGWTIHYGKVGLATCGDLTLQNEVDLPENKSNRACRELELQEFDCTERSSLAKRSISYFAT